MQTWWQCQTCSHTQRVQDDECHGCEVDHLRPGCLTVQAMNLGDAVDQIMIALPPIPNYAYSARGFTVFS